MVIPFEREASVEIDHSMVVEGIVTIGFAWRAELRRKDKPTFLQIQWFCQMPLHFEKAYPSLKLSMLNFDDVEV